MTLARRFAAALRCAARPAFAAPGRQPGVGDLLVAPTRIVLNGRRGTEVILNNIGDDVATYRVSAELRRMTPDGKLSRRDRSPTPARRRRRKCSSTRRAGSPCRPTSRRRSACRPARPQGLPDGEYRVHMLFRAIPPPRPVTAPQEVEGIAFQLIPIYGVTIPVIVRLGNLEAKAGSPTSARSPTGRQAGDRARHQPLGDRSTFGEVRVLQGRRRRPDRHRQRGVAVYTELGQRSVTIPIDPAQPPTPAARSPSNMSSRPTPAR